MGEYYPGTITIGGNLPRKRVTEFIKVLRESGAGPDWDNGLPGDVVDTASLLKLRDKDGHLHMMHSQASGGTFWDLQAWLQENKIPFDAHSDSHYEDNAYNTLYRPELPKTVEVASDNDGGAFVDAHAVLQARAALNEGNVNAALKYLDDAVCNLKDVSVLPKFEVLSYASGQDARRKKGAHRRRR